jgi:hypothetical protein
MTGLSVLHNLVTDSMAEPAPQGGGANTGRGEARAKKDRTRETRRMHYAPGSH